MNEPVGFSTDHFIYRVDRPRKGRDGKCSRCSVPFAEGDLARISGDLDDYHGWWHEVCDPLSASADRET